MTVLGIVFVVLAAGFFLAELEMPGIGIAAAAGTLSLLLGVMFLIDDLPSVRVRLAIVIPAVVVLTIAAVLVGRVTRRRSTQPSSTTGPALLIGELASVRASSDGPQVFVVGAWWSIRPQHPDNELTNGSVVQVVAIDGLTLVVEPPNAPTGTEFPEQGDHQ